MTMIDRLKSNVPLLIIIYLYDEFFYILTHNWEKKPLLTHLTSL